MNSVQIPIDIEHVTYDLLDVLDNLQISLYNLKEDIYKEAEASDTYEQENKIIALYEQLETILQAVTNEHLKAKRELGL